MDVAAVSLALLLTMVGLWGIKCWYGSEAWAQTRSGTRRQRMVLILWGPYLLLLGSVTGLETLSLIPTRPALFFAVYGGVLTSGMSVCSWFAKPNLYRAWAAAICTIITGISFLLVMGHN